MPTCRLMSPASAWHEPHVPLTRCELPTQEDSEAAVTFLLKTTPERGCCAAEAGVKPEQGVHARLPNQRRSFLLKTSFTTKSTRWLATKRIGAWVLRGGTLAA